MLDSCLASAGAKLGNDAQELRDRKTSKKAIPAPWRPQHQPQLWQLHRNPRLERPSVEPPKRQNPNNPAVQEFETHQAIMEHSNVRSEKRRTTPERGALKAVSDCNSSQISRVSAGECPNVRHAGFVPAVAFPPL